MTENETSPPKAGSRSRTWRPKCRSPETVRCQLVDRMVGQDLIRRVPSPTDGRSVLLLLTAKGTRTFRRLAANHIAELLSHRDHLASSLNHLEIL